MIKVDDQIRELRAQLSRLPLEASEVYESIVISTWLGELHGFPETLYGYMMRVFAWIDLLSGYWEGTTGSRGQTKRMIQFMEKYISANREAHSVAIHLWRHKLMHTAMPRPLRDISSGKKYQWLLHWSEHLPEEQHYTFAETADSRILNIGLLYLIRDLEEAFEAYVADLTLSPSLQQKFLAVATELESYEYRDPA
jgi:hypothetical protein